jgi:hypothetical protein
MTRCKLLKYQTAKDDSQSPEDDKGKRKDFGNNGAGIGGMGNRIKEMDAEYEMAKLGRDGKVDCSSCWTVKRDVFDIPMLIVMNVSILPGMKMGRMLTSVTVPSLSLDSTNYSPLPYLTFLHVTPLPSDTFLHHTTFNSTTLSSRLHLFFMFACIKGQKLALVCLGYFLGTQIWI